MHREKYNPLLASWAVVTTSADSSVELFPQEVSVYRYDTVSPESLKSYQVIYFRDPFNTDFYDIDAITRTVDGVVRANPSAYYVDNVKSIDDILIEDKWRQYTLLRAYMPDTKLLELASEVVYGLNIAKKRISARARDIVFHQEEIKYDPEEYILQENLILESEYRVYVICGEVQNLMSRKQPKTAKSKTKVQNLTPITNDIKAFSESISREVPNLDFMGLDVAKTDEGLRLIELNRSPQFSRYNSLGGDDLVEKIMKKLPRGDR